MNSLIAMLTNWLDEERRKLENLEESQRAFAGSARTEDTNSTDFLIMEGLSLPIQIHQQRVEILEVLLAKELAK